MSTATSSTDAQATATMVSLVGSLSDNKAALGRRYGEWAVSAPTLESAVAAAAMAQDELGHARSTYPVLEKLGQSRSDDSLEAGDPLPILATEFPDWTTFVAVNLLVDGMLTTFVVACRDSSIEPLAQRARKILQEEGSHRAHGEAWLRRLSRIEAREPRGLLDRLVECWEQVSRWAGPNDDPGYRAAVEMRMVSEDPDQIRERVRRWLIDLVDAEGCRIELDAPHDWSSWDPDRRR